MGTNRQFLKRSCDRIKDKNKVEPEKSGFETIKWFSKHGKSIKIIKLVSRF